MNKFQIFKSYLRVVLKGALRFSLRMMAFVPPKKTRILFYAGLKGYTCNPKYVCEYINENAPNEYELCWLGRDSNEIEGRDYIKFIKCNPFNLFVALVTSKVFVTLGTGAICPNLKKNLIIGTWHGTPYKKIGYDYDDKFSLADIKHQSMDIMLSVSEDYTEKCIHSGFHYYGRILNCGYPRNDIFFDKMKMNAASQRVKMHYGLKDKVILFAPTFRGGYQIAEKIDLKLDFDKLRECINERFGEDTSIMIRMHYFDKNEYNIPQDIIDANDWADMQELLCATDVLITDYSSTIWDFALTRRPCLLYVPDLDLYAKRRGLYSEPSTWPGIVCESMEELYNTILSYDDNECKNIADAYLKSTGSYEMGMASKVVFDEIQKFIIESKNGYS